MRCFDSIFQRSNGFGHKYELEDVYPQDKRFSGSTSCDETNVASQLHCQLTPPQLPAELKAVS